MNFCKVSELVDINPPTISDLEEMGIPVTSKLCGFVVQLLESEEFLSAKKDNIGVNLKAWSVVPDLAQLFPNPQAASLAASECENRTGVFALFDTGDNFFAWPMFD